METADADFVEQIFGLVLRRAPDEEALSSAIGRLQAGTLSRAGLVKGERAHLAGLNLVGLERRGFTREDVQSLRSAYRMLFAAEGTLVERLDDVTAEYRRGDAPR